jgi:hypothetical protein
MAEAKAVSTANRVEVPRCSHRGVGHGSSCHCKRVVKKNSLSKRTNPVFSMLTFMVNDQFWALPDKSL